MKRRSPCLAACLAAMLALSMSWPAPAQQPSAQQPVARQEKDLAAAGYQRMTAASIRQLIGTTSYVVQLVSVPGAPAGIVYTMYYKSEKERIIRPAPGGGPRFTALWWLEGDLICGEERGPVPAAHRCYSLYQVDTLRYACRQPEGLCASAARTVPGNPDSL